MRKTYACCTTVQRLYPGRIREKKPNCAWRCAGRCAVSKHELCAKLCGALCGMVPRTAVHYRSFASV
jgi:hypothetical protein